MKRVIDIWLEDHGRQGSPRYIAGESYGATRVGVIFRNHKDVKFDGVLLVSDRHRRGLPDDPPRLR